MVALALCGCRTTITNLTPSHQPRNPNNLYPFEVALETSQKSIRKDSVTPSVIIGTESYAMQRAPVLSNRWEALVPIPGNTNFVYYQYKFDYQYDRMPQPGKSSRRSPAYQLEIVDK